VLETKETHCAASARIPQPRFHLLERKVHVNDVGNPVTRFTERHSAQEQEASSRVGHVEDSEHLLGISPAAMLIRLKALDALRLACSFSH